MPFLLELHVVVQTRLHQFASQRDKFWKLVLERLIQSDKLRALQLGLLRWLIATAFNSLHLQKSILTVISLLHDLLRTIVQLEQRDHRVNGMLPHSRHL